MGYPNQSAAALRRNREGKCMTKHPEINHVDREERIRAIAYALWEEEGRPDGRAEAHWLRATELVDAEAVTRADQPDIAEPEWLKRRAETQPTAGDAADKPATREKPARRATATKAA
jgi:hypothetical protein